MLEIKNLHAGYGNLEVLQDVAITVEQNQIVSLIGPNGAGKSTVIKSVFTLADKTKGEIKFKNKNITKLAPHQLIPLGIGYVNQGRINFGNLTIEENLLLGARFTTNQDLINQNKEYVYRKYPVLKRKRTHLAYSLSGGEQQMLALGRALMNRPALLLLDEPSLGLSPKLQKELFAMIQELRNEGLSFLIVEQNAKKAIEISDRTYLLENGRIILEGGKEILKNPKIKNVYLGGY